MISLARAGITVYGLEASWPMIELARKIIAQKLTRKEEEKIDEV